MAHDGEGTLQCQGAFVCVSAASRRKQSIVDGTIGKAHSVLPRHHTARCCAESAGAPGFGVLRGLLQSACRPARRRARWRAPRSLCRPCVPGFTAWLKGRGGVRACVRGGGGQTHRTASSAPPPW
eukprot:gene7880-biopygen15118